MTHPDSSRPRRRSHPGLKTGGLFLATLFLLAAQNPAFTQHDEEFFTIYLVRHAEKDPDSADPKDPLLSPCGRLRAQSLARMLSDIELEKIYSTPFERTLSTADPTASSHQHEVIIYDPAKLEDFSAKLLEARQDALVVGHSNTTPVLAGLLAGQDLAELDEHLYDRLYQVVIAGGHTRINLLHQAFRCEH